MKKKYSCIKYGLSKKAVRQLHSEERESIIGFKKKKNETFYKFGSPHVDVWAKIVFKVLRKTIATP